MLSGTESSLGVEGVFDLPVSFILSFPLTYIQIIHPIHAIAIDTPIKFLYSRSPLRYFICYSYIQYGTVDSGLGMQSWHDR